MFISIFKTKVSTLLTQQIDMTIIDADAYCAVCKIKVSQIIPIFMRNFEYKQKKKRNQKLIWGLLYKQNVKIFCINLPRKAWIFHPPNQKYDYKIILEEHQKHGHILLYKVLPQVLDTIKYYLYLWLAKEFIYTSSGSEFPLVLFVKKLRKKIWFCVDY